MGKGYFTVLPRSACGESSATEPQGRRVIAAAGGGTTMREEGAVPCLWEGKTGKFFFRQKRSGKTERHRGAVFLYAGYRTFPCAGNEIVQVRRLLLCTVHAPQTRGSGLLRQPVPCRGGKARPEGCTLICFGQGRELRHAAERFTFTVKPLCWGGSVGQRNGRTGEGCGLRPRRV